MEVVIKNITDIDFLKSQLENNKEKSNIYVIFKNGDKRKFKTFNEYKMLDLKLVRELIIKKEEIIKKSYVICYHHCLSKRKFSDIILENIDSLEDAKVLAKYRIEKSTNSEFKVDKILDYINKQ